MIQKLHWSNDPYEELTRIKSGLKVEYVCTVPLKSAPCKMSLQALLV